MLEDYEGSRAEFMKMLAEQDCPPAYLVRAQRVEQVWLSLVERCQREQQDLLQMPRLRLAQLAARIDRNWNTLGAYLVTHSDIGYLEQLYDEWRPVLRVQLEATTSTHSIRAALRDLRNSFSRFNRKWERHVAQLSLYNVNFERREYNDYYLVEKSASLGSDKLAEIRFVRLPECTLAELLEAVPCLTVPALV